ncbi:hypothetical protein UlMin_021611, partial [Ulmus minor]
MGKKRERHQNPQPFLVEDDASLSSKKRSKSKEERKLHQKDEKLLSSGMSSKILKQALIQQREIEDEEVEAQNPNNSLLSLVEETLVDEPEDEFDKFEGFSDTQRPDAEDVKIDEEDERLLEAFLSMDGVPQRTLADLIVAKIKQKDAAVASEILPLPKIDTKIIDLYKGVGKLLNTYTAGRFPKAFKVIPSMANWEDLLYLTEPQKWSPNAMYQATRIFASNLGVKKAERFYRLVLLPYVREHIRKDKRLHFALYESLKKSLYKPAAFFKGILFPLCESRTCNLREAVIIGSVIQKVSIPLLHSSVALLKLAEMEYCGTTSYFIKLLLEKKYALPYRALDALVAHFMRFLEDTRIMPVIWHQSLLAFVQRYKNELQKADKENLRLLLEKQKHYL